MLGLERAAFPPKFYLFCILHLVRFHIPRFLQDYPLLLTLQTIRYLKYVFPPSGPPIVGMTRKWDTKVINKEKECFEIYTNPPPQTLGWDNVF